MSKSDKNTLSGLVVSQAMRRQIIKLNKDASISNSINAIIKYKINALLAVDDSDNPVGVLSKTDIMGAYYAGIPIESSIADIMSQPPLFCYPNDALESALQIMRSKGVYRLYVVDSNNSKVVGALAYPDIVGLLYQYCCDCEYSHIQQTKRSNPATIKRTLVKEIMTNEVKSVFNDDTLSYVMEELSIYRFGAILVKNRENIPVGVISKTDLTLAYKHGVDSLALADTIMSSPIQSCKPDDILEDAIKKMIFSDVHRLFVEGSSPNEFVGVFSLSDAARNRSGSCHACVSSRIKLEA
ncbi:MAG: CBS domain-containing protein [Desulfamplus sp.]|nr:CBS domain-containing protein [Desulfamplus sp.]